MAKAKPALSTTPLPSQGDPRNALALRKTDIIAELAEALGNQFNNIMMSVSSCAELEMKKASTPEKRALEQIAHNAGRATGLIQKLLAFSRKHTRAPRQLSLNDVITDTSDLVRSLVGEQIEVVLDLDPVVWNVCADSMELEQLLLSFALTSRSAMIDGGTITLSTRLVELDESFGALIENSGPGKYVALSVSESRNDTGRRPVDQSSLDLGLDLALCASREVVRELQGLIRMTSNPREGTTVEIYLPAVRPEESAPEPQSESARVQPGARTVLIVEDDDAVRIPAAEFLMMEGFKVLQARTGVEAMHLVLKSQSPIDVLLTDIVMPEMSGPEVADSLLQTHPDLRVLYMSGDSGKAKSLLANQESHGAVLQKPFRLQVLGEQINRLFT